MLVTFQPRELWKIGSYETPSRPSTFEYLSKMHAAGKWNKVPPLWITPNVIWNVTFSLDFISLIDRCKPYIIYNGHHRLGYAKQHRLPVKAYIRWTPGNPPMPEEERRGSFYL